MFTISNKSEKKSVCSLLRLLLLQRELLGNDDSSLGQDVEDCRMFSAICTVCKKATVCCLCGTLRVLHLHRIGVVR